MRIENGTRLGDGSAMHSQSPDRDLRELAYELLRKIEHQLGDLSRVSDPGIAVTVAECEQLLADIRVQLKAS